VVRKDARYMHQQVFHIYCNKVSHDWNYKCNLNKANVFEKGIPLPGWSEVILSVIPPRWQQLSTVFRSLSSKLVTTITVYQITQHHIPETEQEGPSRGTYNSYSEGARFESQLGHSLHSQVPVVLLIHSTQMTRQYIKLHYHHSSPLNILSNSLPIRHSICHTVSVPGNNMHILQMQTYPTKL